MKRIPAPSPKACGVRPRSWFICSAAKPMFTRSRKFAQNMAIMKGMSRRATFDMVARSISRSFNRALPPVRAPDTALYFGSSVYIASATEADPLSPLFAFFISVVHTLLPSADAADRAITATGGMKDERDETRYLVGGDRGGGTAGRGRRGACAGSGGLGCASAAQPSGSGDTEPVLQEVVVTGARNNQFGTDVVQAGSFRGARALDVPLTISVIPSAVLQSQQAITLMD